MLAVLTARAAGHAHVPARRHAPRTRSAPRRRARGLAVADKPDSHDVCFIADGDTRGFLARPAGRGARPHRRPRPAPCSARTTAPTASPSASASGLRVGTPGRRRQAPLRAGHRAGDQHGHRRPARGASTSTEITAQRPVWTGCAPPSGALRLPGPAARARRGPPCTALLDGDAAPHPAARPRPRRGQGPGGGPLRRRRRPRQRHHQRATAATAPLAVTRLTVPGSSSPKRWLIQLTLAGSTPDTTLV